MRAIVDSVVAIMALVSHTAWAIPLTASTSTPQNNPSVSLSNMTGSGEPCAQIYGLAAQANNRTSGMVSFDSQLAQACLQSMPFDANRAYDFITALTKYIEFESSLEYMADPQYQLPPVDILGGLESIQRNVAAGRYRSQYDFDTDIDTLINSAHNGHLALVLCSQDLFIYSFPHSLVSIAQSGQSRPSIYIASDALLQSQGHDDVSPIIAINLQDPAAFLSQFTNQQTFQDANTRYNQAFLNEARDIISESAGLFANSIMYPGFASVTLSFANGTSSTLQLRASIDAAEWTYKSGQDLFTARCLPKSAPTAPSPATPPPMPTATSGPKGYPKPIIRDPYNLISGYFLDQPYEDTAVLFIPSFAATETGGAQEAKTFPKIAAQFAQEARTAGKTKLIIDVSANGGGDADAGFNLFKLFFPDTTIYSANRLRDSEFAGLAMKATNELVSDFGYDLVAGAYELCWQTQVNPVDGPTGWTSWQNFYGPTYIAGGKQSAVHGYTNFTFRGDVQGYGDDHLVFSQPPFLPQDIIIIGDGACSSTCTIFVNLMQQLGGNVRTVSFGGFPDDGTMPVMGGVRGSQSLSFAGIEVMANITVEYAANRSAQGRPVLSRNEFFLLNSTRPPLIADFPLRISPESQVNFRNAYNADDLDTALQFLYTPANCRLYYTFENIAQPATMWTAAYDAIWGGAGCVPGSQTTTAQHDGGIGTKQIGSNT